MIKKSTTSRIISHNIWILDHCNKEIGIDGKWGSQINIARIKSTITQNCKANEKLVLEEERNGEIEKMI